MRESSTISIFLNIFDVHVNRTPIPGRITAIDYKTGEFLNAANPKASSANEQNIFTVEGTVGGRSTKVVFSQIAGLIARRIVCYKEVGDVLAPAERVGLIKFGSRVDILFGAEWHVTAVEGHRVKAGESVIALMRGGPVKFRDHLIDPRSPDRKPRRARVCAVPTLFTAGNVFSSDLYALMESFHGAMQTAAAATSSASAALRLRGHRDRLCRAARRTRIWPHRTHDEHKVSDFGREFDSLADVITFGIAPAVLAFACGESSLPMPPPDRSIPKICGALGISSRFSICSAARCAWLDLMSRRNLVPARIPDDSGSQVFCRHADSLCRWSNRGCRLRGRQHTTSVLDVVRRVAGAAVFACVPDGQHLALPQP